jgi:threonyl-tRNA synthetase
MYCVTFPSKKEMDEHIKLLEEAAKRDHRNIGRQQDLFDMNQLSPGCGFMYPKGAIIYNNLMQMIKD